MAKTKMIKVLVLEPGVAIPYEKEIPQGLEHMQQLVGGYIECVRLPGNVDLWCNEEGKIDKLPLNRPLRQEGKIYDFVAGTAFLAKSTPGGNTKSLSNADIERLKKEFYLDANGFREALTELQNNFENGVF